MHPRALGIDFGSRKVGVAMTDAEGRVAMPHSVIENDSSLEERLVSLVRKHDVKQIVFGESHNFLGQPNPIMKKAKTFARSLEERTGIKVEYEPEGLTTIQALKARIAPKKPTASHRRPSVLDAPRMDDAAATLILQNYLEKKRREEGNENSHDRQVAR